MMIFLILTLFSIFQYVILLLFLNLNFRDYIGLSRAEWPTASILIPARNEAEVIANCLQSLKELNYPKEKLQLIFGNDQSTDETRSILQSFKKEWSNCLIVDIKDNDSGQKVNGKANALAQMARHANGEFLLFSDADCEINTLWAKSMVNAAINNNADYVTGITSVKENSFFTAMQNLEWLLILGKVKVLSDLNLSITSMGNNMLIRKKVYDNIGGFYQVPFSLTEDFAIARLMYLKGFKGIHHISSENLVRTLGKSDLKSLMEQRVRWFGGAMELALVWKIILAAEVLFLPSILFLMSYNFKLGIVVGLSKIMIQSGLIQFIQRKINIKVSYSHLLNFVLFEFYFFLSTILTFIYFILRKSVDWKGRTYF
jgi:cellulose synthase/poly-beta-1,6-N-acetylglucosamine synthase-like glycosyltransferase